MKIRTILLLTAAGVALAACDQPQSSEPMDTAPPVEMEPMAPAASDAGEPVAAPSVVDTPPPATPLPPEDRTSEQSVQPESETLFY